MVLMMSILCSCGGNGNNSNKQVDEQALKDSITKAIQDSIKNQTDNDKSISNPFIGKTYKGSGNGGGLYTEMTITFLADNKCSCVSDWYQAYSKKKELQGTYEVKDNQVIVRCKGGDIDYEFVFDVKKDGHVIEFNHSDPSVGGTMGNDFMSLELQGAESEAKKEPVKYHLKGTKDGFMDIENIEMILTVYPVDSKGLSKAECTLHILSPEGQIDGTNNLKGTLKGKKLDLSQENKSGAVSYEGTFDGKTYKGEYSVMSVKAYGGEFNVSIK